MRTPLLSHSHGICKISLDFSILHMAGSACSAKEKWRIGHHTGYFRIAGNPLELVKNIASWKNPINFRQDRIISWYLSSPVQEWKLSSCWVDTQNRGLGYHAISLIFNINSCGRWICTVNICGNDRRLEPVTLKSCLYFDWFVNQCSATVKCLLIRFCSINQLIKLYFMVQVNKKNPGCPRLLYGVYILIQTRGLVYISQLFCHHGTTLKEPSYIIHHQLKNNICVFLNIY